MSFLGKPFQHDLFVSYSHGAFAGRHDADLKLWSQKFAEDLRAELAGTTEFEKISVFLDEGDRSDENVDRTEQLTGLLHDRVAGSALFTLLMTPQYLRSKWCRQELDWWCEKHHPDTLGAGSRVYICRVRPSDEAAWPEPIKDVVGYFCYDRDKGADKARPFTWKGSERDRDDYVDLLVDVSGEMMQRLRDYQGDPGRAAASGRAGEEVRQAGGPDPVSARPPSRGGSVGPGMRPPAGRRLLYRPGQAGASGRQRRSRAGVSDPACHE